MAEYQRRRTKAHKLRRMFVVAALIILVLLAGTAAAGWYLAHNRAVPQQASPLNKPAVSIPELVEKPKPPLINLQPTLDAWVAKQKGDFGIVVYDPDNQQVIASYQGDKKFSTASIYKLYVVHLQLVDIQLGKRDPAEQFRGTYTRQKCIEEAIRTSDSPCAEALMAELGNANINQRLQAYGLTNTSFPAFVTTANDAVTLLARLQGNRDYDGVSTTLLRNVMKTQIYRKGLPLGMPEAIVADKVGFSETPHYHDVAIVTLPNGREYIVAVLSQGASSRQVADFGSTIYAELIK